VLTQNRREIYFNRDYLGSNDLGEYFIALSKVFLRRVDPSCAIRPQLYHSHTLFHLRQYMSAIFSRKLTISLPPSPSPHNNKYLFKSFLEFWVFGNGSLHERLK